MYLSAAIALALIGMTYCDVISPGGTINRFCPGEVFIVESATAQDDNCSVEVYRKIMSTCFNKQICTFFYRDFPCASGDITFELNCVAADQVIDICEKNGETVGPKDLMYIASPGYPSEPEYDSSLNCVVNFNTDVYSNTYLLDISMEPRETSGTGCKDRLLVKANHPTFGENFQLDEVCGVDLNHLEGLQGVGSSWLKQTGMSLTFMTDANSNNQYRGFLAKVEIVTEATTKENSGVVTEVDHCSSQPCQNGGTCQYDLNFYQCSCMSGYSGTNCETKHTRPVSGANMPQIKVSMILLAVLLLVI